MNGELSIKKAKEQQDKLRNLIYKMKKRTTEKKRDKKFSTKNMKIVVYLTKVADEFHQTREKVIAAFEKKELGEPNFEWIRDTEAFNGVLDMAEKNIGLETITDSKVVNLKRVLRIIGDMLSGKINNKYDAEKIYREIMKDENLLRRYRNFSKYKNAQTIATIISIFGYAIFGPLLPSALTSDDIENVDIRDIPELEAKNEPKKSQIDELMDLVSNMGNNKEPPKKGTGLKIMTPN